MSRPSVGIPLTKLFQSYLQISCQAGRWQLQRSLMKFEGDKRAGYQELVARARLMRLEVWNGLGEGGVYAGLASP